jgi:integrase
VVNYREDGKRKRSFFETKRQADTFARFKNSELQQNGIEHAEFPSALRVMAQSGAERLAAFGRTISDAIEFYIAHLKASERSVTVAEFVPQLLVAKEKDGMSRRYIRDMRQKLSRFAGAFPEQLVSSLSAKDIDTWLRSLPVGAVTRNNFRRVLVTFFSDAGALGYAVTNPAAKTAKAKENDVPPGILTVGQAASLLGNASKEMLPYVAIGAFAGLRCAELERLDWSDIHFDADLIEVTAKKSKTARRRFVRIQPNLREWLFPLRKHSGKVTPENFARQFKALRECAGITDWPNNALRHSFASYHLAHFKDAAALALEMGHVNSGMIFAHYRQLVRPKEAEQYWNVKPLPKTDRKIVAIALPRRAQDRRRIRRSDAPKLRGPDPVAIPAGASTDCCAVQVLAQSRSVRL